MVFNMKKAGLSHPLDAARAATRLEDELRTIGFNVHVSSDMAAFNAAKLKLRGSLPSPMHDHQVCVFTHERAFWTYLTDQNGEMVGLQAFRFDDIDTNLADWCVTYMVGVYMRRQELMVPSHSQPPVGSASERLTGKLVYHGEIWIDKAIKNRKVFEHFVKQGLILALIKWQPDAIWGLATTQMATHGHFTRVGYHIIERGFLRWQWSTDSIGPMEYLVAVERVALENMIDEMVAPEASITPLVAIADATSRKPPAIEDEA
jgi:hypothetical protein